MASKKDKTAKAGSSTASSTQDSQEGAKTPHDDQAAVQPTSSATAESTAESTAPAAGPASEPSPVDNAAASAGHPGASSDAEDRDRMWNLLVREKVQMSPDSPLVYHPRFMNREKTRIKAIVRLADGRLTEVEADRHDTKSPFIRDVFAQYTEEEIEMFTEKHMHMLAVRRELDQRIAEDNLISAQRDKTYAAKAEAFQIPELNLPENAEIKNRIRQARNVTEVQAWIVAAMLNTLKKD